MKKKFLSKKFFLKKMKAKNDIEYAKKISDKLDNIITKGFEINRNNILEAEDIKYKKQTISSETYDEFGFLDKYKDVYEKKK